MISHPNTILTAQTPFYGHTVRKIIEEQLFWTHGWKKIIRIPSSSCQSECFVCSAIIIYPLMRVLGNPHKFACEMYFPGSAEIAR